ncbi:MAG: hypothetical protein ACLR8Y_06380 [Alistipes indistinctus]
MLRNLLTLIGVAAGMVGGTFTGGSRRLHSGSCPDYPSPAITALGRGVRWLAAEYVQGTAERVAGVQGGSRRKDTWKR